MTTSDTIPPMSPVDSAVACQVTEEGGREGERR